MIPAYRELAGADIHVADFAALVALALPQAGRRYITDAPLIAGGIPYLRWIYTGSAWALDGEQMIHLDRSIATGVTGTAVQSLKSYALPAGLLGVLRLLRLTATFGRSGTTDNLTGRVLLGTAGLATDAQVAGGTLVTGSARQGVLGAAGWAASATSWLNWLGGGASAMSDAYVSGTALQTPVTIPSTALALKLTMAASMAASTDTPSCGQVAIWGV